VVKKEFRGMSEKGNTDYYRALAERLAQLAARTRSPDIRSHLLATAALYCKLADHADNWHDFLNGNAA
jgi:hypothetical protein